METPEFFQTNYYNAQFNTEKRVSDAKNSDQFIIEDLLDFPNDDAMVAADGGFEAAMAGNSADVKAVDYSGNSSFRNVQPADVVGGPGDGHFASEICVPYDDMAELEWLSSLEAESYLNEDLQKLHLIQGMNPARINEPSGAHHHQVQPEPASSGSIIRSEIPAKARSKRSRAAPGSWRLLSVSATSSSPEQDAVAGTKPPAAPKKSAADNSGEGRKCLHCSTDKTPQWRTGPMGPKTLCNACGVRYKSGRLVPEYRPASSPTFVLTKHSNSHRKVLELRRQKEVQRVHQHQQQFMHHHHHHHHQNHVMLDVSNGDHDYLIHQHIGPDFRQLI